MFLIFVHKLKLLRLISDLVSSIYKLFKYDKWNNFLYQKWNH